MHLAVQPENCFKIFKIKGGKLNREVVERIVLI